MKELEFNSAFLNQSNTETTHQPQDDFLDKKERDRNTQEKLKTELKQAYSEIAELKQALTMKERKIGQLQSKNTVLL